MFAWRGGLKSGKHPQTPRMHGMHGACSDSLQSQYGRTCLHAACERGPLEVVQYLHDVGGKELLVSTDNVSVTACVCVCVCIHQQSSRTFVYGRIA